jgi:low affinity Fe/Cu permease
MNDAQIIAIAITVLAVMGGTLFNNSRIGDINNRIGDVKEVLRAEFRADFTQLEARLDARFNSIDRKLDELLRIVGDHDTRITALEQRPR